MRSARGDTSRILSVGIFSPSVATGCCTVSPWASFARSAWPCCAERATEKNRNSGMVLSGLPSSPPCRGRCPAAVRALPCRTSVGRDVLQHHDEARLRARFVQRVGHAVVQRVEVLAEVRGKVNCWAIMSSTSCLLWAVARLAYRKCWPSAVAVSCRSYAVGADRLHDVAAHAFRASRKYQDEVACPSPLLSRWSKTGPASFRGHSTILRKLA